MMVVMVDDGGGGCGGSVGDHDPKVGEHLQLHLQWPHPTFVGKDQSG